MNRTTVLAGGAVIAALVLCGGSIAMANALTTSEDSHVLPITGVSTASPGTGDVSEHHGDVTAVPPADPTRIDDNSDDAAGEDVGDDNGHDSGTGSTEQGDDHG